MKHQQQSRQQMSQIAYIKLKKKRKKIVLTESRGDMFSKLQTARTPSCSNKGNAPRNWKLSVHPPSR